MLVERSDEGAVATLTLNDPARLNALSTPMLSALQDALDALAEDRSIRAVILRGAGRAFCAGHDLREMAGARAEPDGGRAFYDALFAQCTAMMLTIRDLPQPVIAQVHGVAAAAGCQLVASCDLALAAEDARFGVNGVNIGLFCSTPAVALSRVVPRKAAFELLATGALIPAAEAARLGLVNRAVPPDRLEAETQAVAAQVAAKLGPAMALGKRAFNAQAGLDLPEAYAVAAAAMTENMLREDTTEGVAAFLDKRAPDWRQ